LGILYHKEELYMSSGLKSSLDVAMDRMKKIVGDDEPSLSENQKARIADLRKEYAAKVAEKKILLAGSEELTVELKRLEEEKENKIKAIYEE
jgi:hypothetical protein